MKRCIKKIFSGRSTVIFQIITSTLCSQNLIHQEPLSENEKTVPNSILINTNLIIEGMQFLESIENLTNSNLLSDRKLGNQGGPLKGISTRQIFDGSRLYKKNVSSVVFLVNMMEDRIIGCGSILSKEGHILTNWHVVNGSEKMLVWFYDKNITLSTNLKENCTIAEVIAIDKKRDLALLKLIKSKKDILPMDLGNEFKISIAQDVFAIGHPKKSLWSFSYGAISQIHKKYEWNSEKGVKHIADLILSQTPTNPGNSGGPLFNDKGNLIGINTTKVKGYEGLNFAINISEVKSFYKDALQGRYKHEFSSIINKEEKYSKLFDVDNNGITDRYAIDYGKLNIVIVDKNEDKIPDITYIKSDKGSANWNAEVHDKDGDGFGEYWLRDTNGNGELDNPWIDIDKDGIPDLPL